MDNVEEFIVDILKNEYYDDYKEIYEKSYILQYFNMKMKAIHGHTKARRSLGNIYAIYSILYFYKKDFFNNQKDYLEFCGYDYTKLFNFYRQLYGGSKLQNHSLNSRVNGEFQNKFNNIDNDLIIQNNGKYLIHVDYLYVDGNDISEVVCKITEKYIELLIKKDQALTSILKNLKKLENDSKKKEEIMALLTEDAEARIFEIISYAILKNYYKNITVFFGYTKEEIDELKLELFKTGRTNANDGGIDFVMKPIGRFFQVTESGDYNKYLLDIDKVMHFPISFVIKTKRSKKDVMCDLQQYIDRRTGGMAILREICKSHRRGYYN